MRLTLRMTAATVAASLVVFGTYGAWLYTDEASDLGHATEREARFLSTSLRVGLENALRDRQVLDVEEATLRLEGVEIPIDVYVFDGEGQVVAAPGGLPQAGPQREGLFALVSNTLNDQDTRVVRTDDHGAIRVLVATPLLGDDGSTLGALALSRALFDVEADLRETRGALMVTIGTFILLAGAVATAVGELWLVRPVSRLVQAMQAVRAGELGDRLPVTVDDELAGLTRAFNEMLHELQEARIRAAHEAEGRRNAMHSLQVADRLVTVGQLAATVAHEIGSPLQVLHGRARSLVERPSDAESTARVGAILVAETERIGRMVNQLMSVARARPPSRSEVDLSAAAADVCTLLELTARRQSVRLTLSHSAPVVVTADADQVRQVILNLLTNALAACSAGDEVCVTVERAPGGARLQVADTGAGMDDDTKEHVFEPLFTTRAHLGGAGLGLAVVRSIVLEHGGRAQVHSRPGAGTTFDIYWPTGGE